MSNIGSEGGGTEAGAGTTGCGSDTTGDGRISSICTECCSADDGDVVRCNGMVPVIGEMSTGRREDDDCAATGYDDNGNCRGIGGGGATGAGAGTEFNA